MKIFDDSESTIQFVMLEPGEVFKYKREAYMVLNMMLEGKTAAANLSNGEVFYLSDDTEVDTNFDHAFNIF